MNELKLKYGCNPNQKPSRVFMENGENLPITILNGNPGYINLMDALNGIQLVRELKNATGLPSAASFKHVSPAGTAVAKTLKQAYEKARGADRVSSYGDFICLSEKVDKQTAEFIKPLVSDGVIAPSYDDDALEILKSKRKGSYNIISIEEGYNPAEVERRQIYGITFEQGRNNLKIDNSIFDDEINIVTKNKNFPENARLDLILALITLKYTQSNSVAYAYDGQAIGIGAGQQSRIHCTRLAGNKADNWFLRTHEKVKNLSFCEGVKPADIDNVIDEYTSLDNLSEASLSILTKTPPSFTAAEKKEWLKNMSGISLASDAFFPFGDNIERAKESGVSYIAQPGGSIRDDNVIEVCNKYDIAMVFTKTRLFHH